MSIPFRRILGLDVGSKGIGIAISDPLGLTARGLTLVRRTEVPRDLQELQQLVQEHDVGEIAVGFPRNMDGSVGFQAQAVQEFVDQLQRQIPTLIIALVDERLTTVQAERRLQEMNVRRDKRKQIIDQQAAVIILQTYLEQRENRQRRQGN